MSLESHLPRFRVPTMREIKNALWPHVTFYDRQWEIVDSVERNDETYVPAGNMLGKDFVTGFICVAEFLRHRIARIVTTSVKDDHLRVLWGEINRFINTSRLPLRTEDGGPLIVNHRDVTKVVNGARCSISYLRGMVSAKGEGLAGHHAPYTLGVGDEASGLDDEVYKQFQGWAKRMLFIGNPNPCANFFFRGVEAGDLADDQSSRRGVAV